jgi:hypothetical protein
MIFLRKIGHFKLWIKMLYRIKRLFHQKKDMFHRK